VDKFTPEKVDDRNKEFSWRKAKPSNKVGFKEDHDGIIYCWNIYFRDKGF
jgi:hypothetical protein